MEVIASAEEIEGRIASDLGACLECTVHVTLNPQSHRQIVSAPGVCIDDLAIAEPAESVDAGLLKVRGDNIVSECLHSHLLRSLCPVTAQPDLGSIVIDYRGKAIDRQCLLAYLVSYRNHNDFHEACVERIFCDLLQHCQPEKLFVQAVTDFKKILSSEVVEIGVTDDIFQNV